MSDFYVRFIPENINIFLDANKIELISKIDCGGNTIRFTHNEQVYFADAGKNFVSVVCPSCRVSLMEWWGGIMDSAYSDMEGFINLDVTTPCCNIKTSLHNLEYSLSQGFYKTIIEIGPVLKSQVMPEEIANNLLDITGEIWRIIRAQY